ncbi:MAG: dNTP triphosphohydrolase [bacterium]|nr:dNTP triphosphohydrolase [bacterium]
MFQIRDREFFEELERNNLAPYATFSQGAHQTRINEEAEHPYRTAIQRDRDRIIHSRAFRRLKHKQQVFLISEGDHYRTRITHTMEVAQLSRTMARALGLNEDLVEAIALGHDLGHTPFGHIGEVVLNDILTGKDTLDGLLPSRNIGGFKHNYQSVRVADFLEKKYQFEGLNLTSFVREGILKHTRLLRDRYDYPDFIYQGLNFDLDAATTLEGQVVAMCDEIAQRTHDLEDGIRAGLADLEQVRQVPIVAMVEKKYQIEKRLINDNYAYRNKIIHSLINLLMDDVICTTLKNINNFYEQKKRLHFFDDELVKFSDELNTLQLELDRFISHEIIFKSRGHDINDKNKNIIRQIFSCFLIDPTRLPNYIQQQIGLDRDIGNLNHSTISNQKAIRRIADHVASMTDRFASLELEKFEQESKNPGAHLTKK